MCLTGGAHGPLARAVAAATATPRGASSIGWSASSGATAASWRSSDISIARQERDLARLVAAGSRGPVPLLATNQPLYCRPGGRAVADVFTCIREKTDLDHAGRRLTRSGERELKGGLEMAQRFRDLPDALAASGELALRLAFTLKNLDYRFPEFPLPPATTAHEHLRELRAAGRARSLRQRPAGRPRPTADRARARGHRPARPRRLFPHRAGHHRFLSRAGHPGAGPRLGRQQRGLLCARAHRRRSGGHGSAVRAVSLAMRAANGPTSTSICRAASGGSR